MLVGVLLQHAAAVVRQLGHKCRLAFLLFLGGLWLGRFVDLAERIVITVRLIDVRW